MSIPVVTLGPKLIDIKGLSPSSGDMIEWNGTNFVVVGKTGTGSVVRATSPTLISPVISDYTSAQHAHTGAASGGSLDAAAIGSGTLANGQVNWASPSAIGTGVAAAITGTVITASTKFVGSRLEPASDSTTAIILGKAAGGASIIIIDTTNNSRVGLGIAPTQPGLQVEVGSQVGGVFVTGSETPLVEVGPTLHSGVQLYWAGNRGNIGTDSNAAPLWLLGSNIVLAPTTGTGAIQFAPLGGTNPVMNIDTTNKVVTITSTDAATATVTDVAIFDHGTSAVPLAGFGPALKLRGHSSTNTIRAMVGLQSIYNSPTDASYTTYGLLTAYYMNSGTPTARNAIGWGADGTGSRLGFHSVASAPILRPANANEAAVTTTAAVQITPWGFATQAQADGIVTLVNAIRQVLVDYDLMKGAA